MQIQYNVQAIIVAIKTSSRWYVCVYLHILGLHFFEWNSLQFTSLNSFSHHAVPSQWPWRFLNYVRVNPSPLRADPDRAIRIRLRSALVIITEESKWILHRQKKIFAYFFNGGINHIKCHYVNRAFYMLKKIMFFPPPLSIPLSLSLYLSLSLMCTVYSQKTERYES